MKNTNKKLVGVVSLGCDKNRVDTEIMLTYLKNGGYSFTSDPAEADIIIVNTCGFIKNARNESMDAIIEMSEYKRMGSCSRLIVTGCMPQLWLKEMRKDLPEVDIFLGIDQYPNICEIIEQSYESRSKYIKCDTTESMPYIKNRMVTTPVHYAYLKIADGCNNYCTFCTIPYIRGKYKSRPFDDLIEEANDLVNNGATELILIAQDITKYGTDLGDKKPKLVQLIRELSKIEKLKWIRLLYCYPEDVTDELIDEIENNDKVCKYIDIPLQHVSDYLLKRMNRHTSKTQIEELVKKLKSQPKPIKIRTTFMVGFPGETEADQKQLYEFLKTYKLDHVGFFSYSREEGTPAYNLDNQVPEKLKQKRLIKLAKLQKKINTANNKKYIGQVLDVCYEGIDYENSLFMGRTEFEAPEIDTICLFKSKQTVYMGEHYKVKIKKIKGYDLVGDRIDE